MKILHILDHSLPLHSGYAFRTVALLREQRRLGWETLHVTTPRHGGEYADFADADGWRFHRTRAPSTTWSRMPMLSYVAEMRATQERVRELAQRFRPDVLHAHSPVLNALPALSVGRALGIPVVYEVRALWEDAAVDHGTTREGSARYRVSRMLETYALKRADHITTICEGLRQEIVARGVAAERITVIPNAVDASEFPFDGPPDAALRRELGLDGKTVLGFAGSFYAYEGLDLFIEAFAMLAPRRPQLRGLLIGGGPQERNLRAMVSERGLDSRIRFTGRVPHDEIGRYYGLIDVLAYPRHKMRLTDIVTPLKPLEAMAQGRMFVASDVGGHRELVRDGETGFLFPAGDARALARRIDDLLNRTDDWPAARRRARRFVETERTWAVSVARYADAYKLPPAAPPSSECGLRRQES
ncbi:MAG: TIGR04063 family PEP-CTERM/XrtA system glycosyltransferase [Casimicrobiaceae bacterium]